MLRSIAASAVALVLLLNGCDAFQEKGSVQLRVLTDNEKKIAASDQEFGLDFFRELNANEDANANVVASPLNLGLALGMVLNGTSGQARLDLEAALRKRGLSPEEINESYKTLAEFLVNLDPDVELALANAIWFSDESTPKAPFVEA